MANSPGQFGAYFKTRLSFLNVTSRSYTVYATIYGASGRVKAVQFPIEPQQCATWDNFLDAAGYAGAGAVEFDAWFDPPGGSELNEFLVSSEVYTDSQMGATKQLLPTSAS